MKNNLKHMYSFIFVLFAFIACQSVYADIDEFNITIDPSTPIIIEVKGGVQIVKISSNNEGPKTYWVTSDDGSCVQIAAGKKNGKYHTTTKVKSDAKGVAYVRVKCICKNACITNITFESTSHFDLVCEVRCNKVTNAAQICYLPHQAPSESTLDVEFESDVPYFVVGQTEVNFGNRIMVNDFTVTSPTSAIANITMNYGANCTEYDVYCGNLGINDTCVSFSIYSPVYMVPFSTNWSLAILIAVLITATGFIVKRKYWNLSKTT